MSDVTPDRWFRPTKGHDRRERDRRRSREPERDVLGVAPEIVLGVREEDVEHEPGEVQQHEQLDPELVIAVPRWIRDTIGHDGDGARRLARAARPIWRASGSCRATARSRLLP